LIFFEGAQFAVCPMIAEQWDSGKKKKERLTDEVPISYFVCKSFLSILLFFPSVACFRCRMPFKRVAGSGKVFGLNTFKLV